MIAGDRGARQETSGQPDDSAPTSRRTPVAAPAAGAAPGFRARPRGGINWAARTEDQ
ncbi:hypothetical protein [Streptomyces mirabilis]|uniref:hypothetical protein n=1 Tax=Streptomyces mirabilis TaxID=68239 RepID=UPI0015A50F63|nr:hypothetical protein [Streptomyces mirabilis]